MPGPLPKIDSDLTIEKVWAGFAKRLESRGNLSFRYSLATRYRMATGSEAVSVQVADVVLGPDQKTRLDILAGLSGPELAGPDGATRVFRQFVARDKSSLATFQVRSEKGLVPFRWQSVGGRAVALGDNLALALMGGTGTRAIDSDRTIDPLEPRPANVLDLAGASVLLLGRAPDYNPVQADMAGVETVDGREAVRVAWFAYRNDGNGGGGLRGLLCVAPSLGFAVVRSEASQDPSQVGTTHGRRAWRRAAGDFVEVGGLWLPRKVEDRFTQLNPDGNPARSQEIVAIIENYRVDPDLPPDTFRPRFKIEALDEKTGQFTTLPPEPAPGLVDRLKRAVAESPFGPPRFAEPAATPAADRRGTDIRSNNRAAAQPVAGPAPVASRAFSDIVADVDQAPTGRLASDAKAPAPAQTGPVADPAPRPADSTPAPEPAKADPAPAAIPASDARPSAEAPTTNDRLSAEIERRFKLDPVVMELAGQIKEARKKLDEVGRTVRVGGDPAARKAQDRLNVLTERYDRLWEQNNRAIREQLEQSAEAARDELALLRSRRDVKGAAVLKAEAQRDLAWAVVTRNSKLVEKNPTYVSNEERTKAETELQVAEAEVAGKKAELAEADLGLEQARRRLGLESVPDRAPTADAPPAAGGTLADLRDAVELMEVQLRGKQAELRGVETKAVSATRLRDRISLLASQKVVGQEAAEKAEADSRFALSEIDQKKTEVVEFEVRLKQAKRRAEAEEARLRREADRMKTRLEWSESMARKGYLSASQLEADRARYDELMFQLDPKHVPAKAPTPAPAESPTPELPR